MMNTTFKLQENKVRKGESVIEVWNGPTLIGEIFEADSHGKFGLIRITSQYGLQTNRIAYDIMEVKIG